MSKGVSLSGFSFSSGRLSSHLVLDSWSFLAAQVHPNGHHPFPSWDRVLGDPKLTTSHFFLSVLFSPQEVDRVPASPALLALAAHPLQRLPVPRGPVTQATELGASPALSGTAILVSLGLSGPFWPCSQGLYFLNTYFLLKRKSAL